MTEEVAPTPLPPSAVARCLRAVWRLLTSMRFAIALLGVMALASLIGTVLPQQQPYSLYVGLYGAFWADVFEALGLFHIYQSAWYLLILCVLVASTSACMARHVPVIVREWRDVKEDIPLRALQALGHKQTAMLAQAAPTAARNLGQQLADAGWQVRLQERALAAIDTPEPASGVASQSDIPARNGWLLAARKGRFNRIGYLATHGAVVLIGLGSLLDSSWLLRAHMAVQGKTPYRGSGLVAQVPATHQLGPGTPGFRGQLRVAEGARSAAAIVPVGDGVVIQDLPFAVELLQFHAEHYPNGVPRLFASDVRLHDPAGGPPQRARIAVNQPLRYRDITLYQSGFEDGGSAVTLQALALDGRRAPFDVRAQVGGEQRLPVEADGADATEPRTLEITGLQLMNPQPLGAAADANAHAAGGAASRSAATASWWHWLRQQWGASPAEQTAWRDLGPSVSYRLRDAAGQALEFHSYMRPVDAEGLEPPAAADGAGHTSQRPSQRVPQAGREDAPVASAAAAAQAASMEAALEVTTDASANKTAAAGAAWVANPPAIHASAAPGAAAKPPAANAHRVPHYLFGVRENAAQPWRYLRVPADADGGLDEFIRLRRALLDPQQRQQAARAYAAQAAPAGDAALAQQLAQTAQRVLDRFAGDPAQWPQARRDLHAGHLQSRATRSFGLAGVAAWVESQVPPDQHEPVSNALLRMLNGSLLQLLQSARQQAGLPPLDMAQPRHQAFMSQAVLALSDAPFYPEPLLFVPKDYQPVQASVLQVARAPGQAVVYAGSTLLVLGILCLFFVRERRLWVWLTPDEALPDSASQALLAYSSNRRSHEGECEFRQLAAKLLRGGEDEAAH
ncbi:MAG: cytochrome c biogenesis protein ResB [Brachymonas sp.]|nr:cytochrome c biogenesis protein ResB [Brachymonas sp.]